ncbi:MAG: ABC transporter ATP-binding protein/permease [Rickettsiales bacterium]|nr:ABC transporter ATP-binding protein/permease [Rickettsiales bacterium]
MLSNRVYPFLWEFVRRYLPAGLLFVLLNVIATSLGDVLVPRRLGILADGLKVGLDIGQVLAGTLALTLLSLLYILFDFLVRAIYLHFFVRIKNDIYVELFSYVEKLSMEFFRENLAGSVSTRIVSIADTTERLLFNAVNVLTVNIFVKIFVLYLFYRISLLLSLLNLLWMVAYVMMIFYSNSAQRIKIKKYEEEKSIFVGRVNDSISNISNVKNFAAEEWERKLLAKQVASLFDREKSALAGKIFIKFLCNVMSSLPLLMNLFLSLKLYQRSLVSLGDIFFVLMVSNSVVQTTKFIGNTIIELAEQLNRLRQNIEATLVPRSVRNQSDNVLVPKDSMAIDFENVYFRYRGDSGRILENFSFHIGPGQKVGLVGRSGSGKTTLVNLLLRLQDVESGDILVDGRSIRTAMTQESLRGNISYIPQQTTLFHRTVRENILCGSENVTEEKLLEVCRKACCLDFIENLENGLNTIVGERGSRLSGGQSQRIAIARAMLRDSPILVFDEMTSGLDSITEQEIQDVLKNLLRDRTVLTIAHRLATLKNMERIVVMENGRIVEDGTIGELISIENGLFRRMWSMQRDGLLLL